MPVGAAVGVGHQLVHFVAHQRVLLDQGLGHRDHRGAVLLEQHLDALEVLIEQAVHLAARTSAADRAERAACAEEPAVRSERAVHAEQLDHVLRNARRRRQVARSAGHFLAWPQEDLFGGAARKRDLHVRQQLVLGLGVDFFDRLERHQRRGADIVARFDRCSSNAFALEQLDRCDGVSSLVVGQAALVGVAHADDRHAHAPLVRLQRPAEVLVVDGVASIPDGVHHRLVDDVLDLDRRVVDRLGDHLVDRQVGVLDLGQVVVEDLFAAVVGRRSNAQSGGRSDQAEAEPRRAR